MQGQRLAVQMALQGVLAAGQLGHIGLAVTRQVVAVGWGLAPPLAVIRGQAGAAVALPTLAVIGGQRGQLGVGFAAGPNLSGEFGRRVWGGLGVEVVASHRRVGTLQPKLLSRRFVAAALQERVLIEHLLYFLAHLQRRELQQPDRLLKLRRERQVLRNTQRETGFHGTPWAVAPPAAQADRWLMRAARRQAPT